MKNTYFYGMLLENDFFRSREMRLLRAAPFGAEMVLIYLQMLAESSQDGGFIRISGRLGSIAEELSALLGEPADLVETTLCTLEKLDLLQRDESGGKLRLPYAEGHIRSETDVARRMRVLRAQRKEQEKTEHAPAGETAQSAHSAGGAAKNPGAHDVQQSAHKVRKEKKEAVEKSEQRYERMVTTAGMEPFSDTMDHELRTWFRYRDDMKKPYASDIGMEKFLKEIRENTAKWGESNVCRMFDKAMSRGWQGVFFDELEKSSAAPPRLRDIANW